MFGLDERMRPNFGGSSTTQVMSSDINNPNSPYNRNNNPDRN